MLKSHESFHSANGKRLVLVVDDDATSRELLASMLASEYDVRCAGDGKEAMARIAEWKDTLSLILLDLMMPVMSGYDVLRQLKADARLRSVPVIVLTADQSAEIATLGLGASDFIPKPYPQAGVVLARVRRTIELHEDRQIINSTERDAVTGLYNREYFLRYAEQFDQHHKGVEMDAIVVDVNHFHMINERFGTAYGDEVLRRIGERLRDEVHEDGGIVCRQESDTFLVYCPHGRDYRVLLSRAVSGLTDDAAATNRVRLRMGVYPCADKALDIERRFDRAKMAADSVRGSFTKTIGLYDQAMHEKDLFAERLIEDFPAAIREQQFTVYFQPKYDIRSDAPALSGAEALVRWQHPEFGLIPPDTFIPLFESNGLIQQLDSCVWEQAARQIRTWKDQNGISVPVSVNMSRIDMYEPNLVSNIQNIIKEYGLTYQDLTFEVTESAYTQDSEQIVQMVHRLRKLGFRVEMDDFGSGYSSLNMIAHLPIDALKLERRFVHSATGSEINAHMLRVIIDLAAHLSVPVVAEGVETEEQLAALREAGCDLVQGYYFSKPLPAEEFTALLASASAERPAELPGKRSAEKKPVRAPEAPPLAAPADATSSGPAGEPTPSYGRHTVRLRTMSLFFMLLSVLAAVALFASDISVTRGYQRMEQASRQYIVAQVAASDMESGSDYLTDRVRCFVVTGDLVYLQDFFEEVEVTRRRDKALDDLEEFLDGNDSDAYNSLATALNLSNELIGREYLAMRLMLESDDYPMEAVPQVIANVQLRAEDYLLSPEEQKARARSLVFDDTYMNYKDRIRENIRLCTQEVLRASNQELEQASSRMALLVNLQTAMTILFLGIVFSFVLYVSRAVRKPLTKLVSLMREEKTVTPTGAEELRFVMRTYNTILQENRAAREHLSHEASHDALTGLLNRGAYEMMLQDVDREHIALVLIDVDCFKQVNDTYGHDVGDRVLRRVAEILKRTFRSVDIICRIGGDEFVVIMTRADSSMRELLKEKILHANELLQHPLDDLPPVSLSVGAAFADRDNPSGDIFRDADTALYRVKEAGRCGCEIY